MNSNISIQCGYSYGELNVYLTCAGLCGSDSIQCPLQHPKGDDCLNMKKRVITITSDNALAVVYPHNGSFHGDIFACSNKRCVTYEKVCNLVDKVCNLVDKVCNLVDDCVASSDEENCYNHFEWANNLDLVPLSSKCDNKINCSDFSDECDDSCKRSNHTIVANDIYLVISIIFGALAILFNTVVTVKLV